MSRQPRVYGETGIYHVILRGNNRQNLFCDDYDRNFFLKRLKKYSAELHMEIHAYCLMNNHVHILLEVGNENKDMGRLMQKVANSYVFYFNLKYDRCGHLFQGRYKSEPIQDEIHFKTVFRYILQNCEKSGLGRTEKYRWNSFNSLEKPSEDDFVNVEYIKGMFRSKKELLDFILQKEEKKCMEYENKIVFSDDRAAAFIGKLFGISSPYKLERLKIDEQIKKCRIMRNRGLSASQITRITGISRRIIKMAKS